MMKTIECKEPNQFVMKEVDVPQRKADEALIKIQRIGICGTDLHAYKGNQPFFSYPRVLGHELAAEIVEIADNEYGLKSGDQVAVLPYLACGLCIACRNGKTNCCTDMKVLGVHEDGGMREYLTIPPAYLIKTDGISVDQSAIIEPLSISAHAVRRADIKQGETVLVIGAGPIGLGVMKYAKIAGAKVIAMDINDERLDFCKSWVPVDATVNALHDPVKQLTELTNDDLPTVVFDATGNKQSMMAAFDYVAHGGKLVYVGLIKEDISFNDPDFHKKEMTLMGSRNATKDDFEYVVDSIRNGQVSTDAFITHRASFDEMTDQFESWLNPETGVIKALVEL